MARFFRAVLYGLTFERIAGHCGIDRVCEQRDEHGGRSLRERFMSEGAHDRMRGARNLAQLARRKAQRERIGQRIDACKVVLFVRSLDQLREDLCRLRLALKHRGGGLRHASQTRRLVRVPSDTTLRSALVERSEEHTS